MKLTICGFESPEKKWRGEKIPQRLRVIHRAVRGNLLRNKNKMVIFYTTPQQHFSPSTARQWVIVCSPFIRNFSPHWQKMGHIWNKWIPDMFNSVAHFSRAPEAAVTWQCVNGKPAGIQSVWQACTFLLRETRVNPGREERTNILQWCCCRDVGMSSASSLLSFYLHSLIYTEKYYCKYCKLLHNC